MVLGLYYILWHESTYCNPTPLFCADVRALAHRLIIHALRIRVVWWLMIEVGLYYIASHETTNCTPTPVFIDTVKCIAHGI